MAHLNEDARRYLSGSGSGRFTADGITEIAWARYWGSGDPVWTGDACGCPDDRCIGYHHGADEPCGCLRVLVRDYEDTEDEAIDAWDKYQANDPSAVEVGREWVERQNVAGLSGWSFEIAVNGEAGIAIKTIGNPEWRLLWSAGRADEW